MLVLSRKKDESIVINNEITIVVVEIRGDKVRLGIEAPKDVPVHRREVFDAIARDGVGTVSSPSPTTSGEAKAEQAVGDRLSDDGRRTDTGCMAEESVDVPVAPEASPPAS